MKKVQHRLFAEPKRRNFVRSSRKIMYLKASTNNKAITVFSSFLVAVNEFGLPKRVRSDKVSSNYYAAFRHLEDIGELDPDLDVHLICLHYVMIPRINMHLHLFRRTWDNHPMSSESNKSPQQLWISGLLLNQRPLTDTEDDHTFGIDWDGPVGTADPANHVSVPEADTPLKAAIEARLQETINPLQPSTCFGLDLYIKATQEVQFVTGM
ncbi:hypothetical protein SKAU_G00065080 [Synaphobranchus kaupii]|uniref:Integrase core domain-containing protein n=1 Tax=Synaphobranchus kaupii TaxID=118154 RepID=A0A9Q1G6G4_SYNKA|nr:hypothetical protein SKAU_G00065080 [Synaphobranchus kaupii]